ncbi:hypothetical protein AAMO2058_000046900, partial [Amorphochlora amoebiformis]
MLHEKPKPAGEYERKLDFVQGMPCSAKTENLGVWPPSSALLLHHEPDHDQGIESS